MKYLLYAPHNWTTTEALYAEIVNVEKGYALVSHPTSPENMRSRGYDVIAEVEEDDNHSLEELIEYAQTELGHKVNTETFFAAPVMQPESPYQNGHGEATARPTH